MQLGGEGTPPVQDFCLGEIALARGTGVMATENATADTLDLIYRLPETWEVCLDRRGGPLRRPAGREAVSAPAGRPGRGGGPGGRADHRPRVRRPGARGRGGQDHRGRPRPARRAGRGRAPAALRVLLAHRRVRAAHRHRPGRGRRRGLGRRDRGPGRRDHRAALPGRHRGRGPVDRVRLARPPRRAPPLLLEHRDPQEELDVEPQPAPRRSRPTCSTPCARSTCPRWHPRRSSTCTSTRPRSTAPAASPGSRASARSR